MTIRVFPDAETLSQAAAEIFVKQAQRALVKHRFTVALAGGSTPRRTYELLAQSPLMDEVPWKIVHLFWGDERWVPPNDAQSNEGMARKSLLDHVPVPSDSIYPMFRPDINVAEAASAYDAKMREFFAGEPHLFDLIFLGLGANGHTASLFPHTPVLHENERWTGVAELPEMTRMTLTAEAINRSATIVFLVNGADKAEIVHGILEGPRQPEEWPAQLIKPHDGEVIWLLDEAAASRLSNVSLAAGR